ncbi:sulfurtransferase TusA family protein [Kitasatospora sp. SUK 42]|uniref:sulfurtransferase TusA family protein n=1 Tax=Kitasatospora sp. SUK 42 TaxID=1588882 RepID=UPI0018C8EB6B|nr:sulfurtransferase TusA family protein [Kitasatospora sp. SUK 42]MBV2155471.1 sulfurtransferase TusA family protein [Kitasatospora sp. SUK 42]
MTERTTPDATSDATPDHTAADLTVDGTGLLCVQLLLRLRARIAHLPAGAVVHIRTTDPAAPLDLPAWCHLTGHAYLGPVPTQAADHAVYALRLTSTPVQTRADRPWHPAPDNTDSTTTG